MSCHILSVSTACNKNAVATQQHSNNTMKAFLNTPITKAQLLAQLQAHHDSDQIVQGRYWENGKGCAVGCSIHGSDHYQYETQFGIPVGLAWIEDRLFEWLPNDKAKTWPIRFTNAIPEGADLAPAMWKFGVWLMESGLCQDTNHNVNELGLAFVVLFQKKADGKEPTEEEIARARALDRALARALDRAVEVSEKLLEFLQQAPVN